MGVPFAQGYPFMQYAIVAGTWASFSRTVAAAAIGLWLAFAICPAVFAADGPQAAAAAKEAAAKLQAYLRDLEKSKGQPDYAKPPASEYLKRIFNTDALAALPAPKVDDLSWLSEWVTSVGQAYAAMIMFGAKDNENAGRNLVDYQDHTLPAMAFTLRLNAYAASAMPAYLNSLPPGERAQARGEIEQRNRGLAQMATGMAGFLGIRLKLESVRLTAAALRDTVTAWAPLATAKERTDLLTRLEKARVANKDAGIDDAINFVSTTIKSVKD
jgi:hypothetical protein